MLKKENTFKRIDILLLIVICIIAFTFRLYKISTPLADWHSWRQVDTSAVSRNFAEKGFNLLKPTYDDLSNVQTGQYNPEGLRLVEFPLYNALVAGVYKILPVTPIEQVGRLVTVFLSLIVISVIYYLALAEHSRTAAVFSSLIYAVFPFFVYYSRVVLPETPALAAMFLAIFFLYQWDKSSELIPRIVLFSFSCIFAAIALLIKPPVIFYFLVLDAIFLRKYGLKSLLKLHIYLFFLLAIAPMLAWRLWIQQFPVGIPAYQWLITTVQTYEGPKVIFMKPAFFRWVFYERILILIMGGWASSFIIVGALRKFSRSRIVIITIGISALLYLLTFQGGNVQHDYYQTMILPALALFAGVGIATFYESRKLFMHPFFTTCFVLAALGFSWAMSYQTVKGYYGYSEGLINTAQIIKTITPADALVVTDSTGDTTLLYNAHRRGMPSTADTLPNLKNRGMEYFVTHSSEVSEKTQKEYPEYKLIFKNNDVFIFKL